jgi:DNA processing protein
LSARDVVVVSGGAYGIDGMAHRATLASGGATIAVLAGGIDRLYPAGHEVLLTRVAEQGLLLSEVPCGTPPTKWRFLQRNRLIAALAEATVVVEAGRRSGSLNTARHALDMGRPVGIVPGPITSAASAGCHAILRTELVTCVTSTSEIMQLAFGDDGVLPLPMPDPVSQQRPESMPESTPDQLFARAQTPSPPPESAGSAARAGSAENAPSHSVLADSSDATADQSDARPDPLHVRVIDALRPRRGQSPSDLAREVGEGADRVRAVLGVLGLDGAARRGADGLWRGAPAQSQKSTPVS